MALAGKGSKMANKGRRMVFLLSPAKTVNFERGHPDLDSLPTTRTSLGKQTDLLLKELKGYSKGRIKSLMSVSDNIAALNHDRYQHVSRPMRASPCLPPLPHACAPPSLLCGQATGVLSDAFSLCVRAFQFESLPERQAAIAFDGQAYSTMRAFEMSKNQLLWLNDQ